MTTHTTRPARRDETDQTGISSMRDRPELTDALERARAAYAAMSPLEQAIMRHEQAKSFARGITGADVPATDMDLAVAELDRLRAENERLREALEWYGEQARRCRSEGTSARHNLMMDAGDRARAALSAKTGDGHE